MLKETLNKGISTPIAIGIILILAIIIGSFTYWQYSEIVRIKETPEIELPEKEIDSKYCVKDNDCVVFGETGDCNCGCFNKNYQWQLEGECFCLTPISCKCLDGKCEGVFEENTNWKTYRSEEYKFEISFPEEWQITTIPYPETQSYIKSLFAVTLEKPIKDFICRFEIEVVDLEKSLIQKEIDSMVSLNYKISEATTVGFSVVRLAHAETESCVTHLIEKNGGDYFRIDQYVIEKFLDEENVSIYLGDIPECTAAFYRILFAFNTWN